MNEWMRQRERKRGLEKILGEFPLEFSGYTLYQCDLSYDTKKYHMRK